MTELEKVQQAEQNLRELLSEARGMIKDLRAERKSLEEFIKKTIEDKIGQEVSEGLDQYKNVLEHSINTATDAVFKRFDTMTKVLLGIDKKSKKERKDPIEKMITQYIEGKSKE